MTGEHTSYRGQDLALRGKRVCMVAPFAPRKGGVTVQTELLVKHLRDEGVEILRVDTNLQKLRIRRGGTPIRLMLQPWVVLARLLRQIRKCDIVHIQGAVNWGFLPAIIAVPVSMLFRKPCVLSFHSGAGPEFIDKFPSLIRNIFRQATQSTSVSVELQAALRERGIETELLNNLFDRDLFTYRERPRVNPRFVWIRSLDALYDPMTALQTFQIIKQRYPDATLVLAGNGRLEWPLRAYIAEHKICGVTMPGMLSRREVAKALDASDICLNTTRYDGLPSSLLEAAAAGTPIVTTAAGGINSMFKDGLEAMIAPIGDAQALADRAIELLEDPARALRMAEAARLVTDQYTWDSVRWQISQLYSCDCPEVDCAASLAVLVKSALTVQVARGIISTIFIDLPS